MATFRYICFDILTQIKKVNASSDIGLSQIQFWASMIANRLRYQHIAKNRTGRFLSIYTGIPIQTVGVSANPGVVKNRRLIVLPASVYDYENEKGIEYICHTQDRTCPPEFTNQNFQPTTPASAARLYFSPYEKPSPKNVYFYRAENILYFLGLETANIASLEMGLYTSIEMKTNLISLDSELDLTEQHLTILKQEMLQWAAYSLAVPKDVVNTGEDETPNFSPKQTLQPGQV